MRTRQFLTGALVIGLVLAAQPGTPALQPSSTPLLRPATHVAAEATLSRLPLQFEVNAGQAAAGIKFLAHGRGYDAFFTADEVALAFTAPMTDWPAPATLRLQFKDANPEPAVIGQDQTPGVVNYYLGRDPAQWRTGIPTFARVRYRGIYDGVDAAFYGNGQELEYDLIVAPDTDPNVIALKVQGADSLEINRDGDLLLNLAAGQARLRKPLIYQEAEGQRHEIAGGYVLRGEREFGFVIAAYDANRPLIIDPVLDYSTYFGGDGDDYGYGIAVDSVGNIYMTGATNSTNFPLANATQPTFGGGGVACPSDLPTRVCYDAFVTKINAAGTAILYSTYLGDPGDDEGRAIAVDSAGNAYVTGQVSIPGAPPNQDLYIYKYVLAAKFDPTGNLIYAHWLGSVNSIGLGVTVDADGRAYITGEVGSSGFPTTADAIQPDQGELIDAFVSVLNPAGDALVYSTYLGGNGTYCGECYSSGHGIAVDSAGYIYVTGQAAPSFPVTSNAFQGTFHGFWQAFVAKIDRTQSGAAGLVYSTYLGGTISDFGNGIALDSTGKVYVTGSTQSDDFPTTGGAFDRACGTDGRCNATTVIVCDPPPPVPPHCHVDAKADVFVAKLDLSKTGAASLVYSTFVGGSGQDVGKAITVDSNGRAYVTGSTKSPDFPQVSPVQSSYGTNLDAVVLKLNGTGSQLMYSTYLGGGGDDEGNAIAVDSNGSAYVAGYTGSGAFPIAHPLRPRSGGWEAFIARLSVPKLTQRAFLPIVIR